MNIHERFKNDFEKAFEWLKLTTDTARDLQVDAQIVSEVIVGPLYAISIDGNCDYVFKDGETRFSGIKTANELRIWLLNLAREYHQLINKFSPSNDAEIKDHKRLLGKAEAMLGLVELAYQIQKTRE